ncbi:MAG: aldose 1-epimerase, partial [Acidimicrobiia bacterium]|nr:aldose 1-epimerase [Acidimicrobiia bacterium]
DTTFTGWDGRAFIETHGARIAVQSDLPNLHVYSPTGRGFFCLEPVGAAPDALNQPERGGEIVPPGQLASASMRISLVGSS